MNAQEVAEIRQEVAELGERVEEAYTEVGEMRSYLDVDESSWVSVAVGLALVMEQSPRIREKCREVLETALAVPSID